MTKIQLDEFADQCRRAASMGLMQCSSGNISCRAGDGLFLIKASRAWISNMTAKDVAVCRIADCVCVNDRKPSVETAFHAGILRERPDVNVVMHFQSQNATTIACCNFKNLNFNLTPEVPFYIGEVGEVAYFPPGSPELAKAVVATMKKHDMALLRNHGQIVVAPDFDHAIQSAVFFEMTCGVILKAGSALQPLAEDAVRALRSAAQRSGPV